MVSPELLALEIHRLEGLANACAAKSRALEQVSRKASREQLQSLNLTEPQQLRFNEVLRGIDRRFSEVMARKR